MNTFEEDDTQDLVNRITENWLWFLFDSNFIYIFKLRVLVICQYYY